MRSPFAKPNSPAEWRFVIALFLVTVCGLGWFFTHFVEAHLSAMKGWISTLAGDGSLKLKTRDFIRGGLMVASLVWIGTGAMLLLTRGWWWREPIETPRQKVLLDRSFVLGLGCDVALGLRYPRMDLGLYNDEIDAFRAAIAGMFDREAAGDLTQFEAAPFQPIPWSETLGKSDRNNHSLHSLLARSFYDAWHAAAGAVPGQIKEWPLRLPALLGGMLSIFAAGALTRLATGSSRAGLFTAFILALHPWHVRYSTEGRGYGLVFGFGTLAVLFLALAIRDNRWRWWLAFGASQAFCLWSCIGSVYLIAAANLVGLALMIFPKKRSNPVGSAMIPCWIVATALSASAFFLMAAPILPPFRLALLQNATFQSGVPPRWWSDVLSLLFTGMPWHDHDVGNPVNPATIKYLRNPLLWAGGITAVIAAVTGAWRLWARGGVAGRLAVATVVLSVVAPWVVSVLTMEVLLKWYVCYATIFVGIWIGTGFDGWLRAMFDIPDAGKSGIRRRLMTYALLGLYGAAVVRPLMLYRNQSKQSMRGAVKWIRGGVFPFSEEQLRPLTVGWWTHANYYDPHLRVAHTPARLQSVIDRARSEHRPLYFILGMRERALAENPEVVRRLESSGEFTLERIFPGLEEAQFRTYVFRLKESQFGEKSQSAP